jgi:6-phosphogluconolactonase/glucosamine-6-phosphate isomerase/deaminase
MIITRISKGTPHDVYNSFITKPYEDIRWSDWNDFIPDERWTFKKSIKDDFIV